MTNYVEITGPDFAWSEPSDHAHEHGARQFVQRVNLGAAAAERR